MIALLALLSTSALASSPTVELETVAQVRHDLFGDRIVPATQYLRLGQRFGHTRIDADAALEWIAGTDHPLGIDVFTLQAHGETSWGSWTAGRQHALTAHRHQTFDGARFVLGLAKGLSLETWAGIARHHDLDDLAEGIAMGRVAARYNTKGLAVRLGAEVEGWTHSSLVARQDLEGRYTLTTVGAKPYVQGRVVVAEPAGALEWARVELGGRPVPVVQTSLFLQRREVVDSGSLFGAAILESITGGAITEAGVGVRVDGPKLTALSTRYSLTTYEREAGDQYGHAVNVEYVSGARGLSLRWLPAYAFRTGPGGTYHALYARCLVDLGEQTQLTLRGAVVPFRKGHAPWDVATDGMVEVRQELSKVVHLGVNADAAVDRLHVVDLRVGAFLTVEAR